MTDEERREMFQVAKELIYGSDDGKETVRSRH
jgi:hypothetical protein